jgi:hypothetical protein
LHISASEADFCAKSGLIIARKLMSALFCKRKNDFKRRVGKEHSHSLAPRHSRYLSPFFLEEWTAHVISCALLAQANNFQQRPRSKARFRFHFRPLCSIMFCILLQPLDFLSSARAFVF